jgi:prepilin-type processing-associated H-X9-DG protein
MKGIRPAGIAVLALCLTVASCSGKQGNSSPLEKYIPGEPIVYAYWQGLDEGAKSFEGTELLKILREPEVKDFRTELAKFIDEKLKEAMKDERVKVSWDEIRMLLDCEAALALTSVSGPTPGLVIVVRPGPRKTAVKTLVDRILKDAATPDMPVTDKETEGVKYKQAGSVAVWWNGDDLVICVGNGTLANVVKATKGQAPSLDKSVAYRKTCTKVSGGREFLAVHFDPQKLFKELTAAGHAEDRAQAERTWKGLGMDSVSSVHLSVSPQAPGVKTVVYIHTPGGPKGLVKVLPMKPIDETKMLAGVPEGAMSVMVARCSLAESWDVVMKAVADCGEGAKLDATLAEINGTLGFDLRKDLLASLGDEMTFQILDAGGVMIPNVCLTFNVTDPAKCADCVDKLRQFVEKAASAPGGQDAPPGRRFGVQKMDYKGRTITAVILPVPLPVAPAFALSKDRLIAGIMPQTVKSAIDLQDAPLSSVAAKADFKTVRPRVASSASLLTYNDVKAQFPQAYAAALQMLNMINNMSGMMQPMNAGNANQPLIPQSLLMKMPTVNAFTPHLFGSVEALSWDGEGFLLESYGTFGGSVTGGAAGAGIMAGFMLPALANAQEAARRAACMSNMRGIGLALLQYAGDNDDKFPPTLGVLLKEGHLTTVKVFVCPSSKSRIPANFMQPMDFKAADLALLNKVEEFGDYVLVKGITHAADAEAIVLYEKDGAHSGQGRNVFFNDGHVKWYREADFQTLLKEQQGKLIPAK